MTNEENLDSRSLLLSDGRRLGYTEYGNTHGKPVFYFHGNMGSRLEAAFGEEQKTTDLGIRFICIDRPGMGFSDYQPDRRILDLPHDILELAKELGLDGQKFVVMGGSGGGPYALACAYKIPAERLISCAVVSGLGPYEFDKTGMNSRSRNQLFIARYFPLLSHFSLWFLMGRKAKAENKKWWEDSFQKIYKNLPTPDKEILSPLVLNRMIIKTIEAFRQGSKGPAHDFKLFAKPWGFKLEEIAHKTKVFLFHGELDTNVPISMAQEMSQRIPNCETKFYQDEGHLSVFINNFTEIMTSVVSV